jgi:hypothetical protein
MKVTLDLPEIEGFELAEGKQPRPVKFGEYSINMETLEATQWNGACTSFDNAIVLKKKAPKYETRFIDKNNCLWIGDDQGIREGKTYVEIKALEDALKLMHGRTLNFDDMRIYDELKSLIK